MAYYVSASDVTPEEPSSGWYYVRIDEDGGETICGPFWSKSEAMDDETDGAYSDYLEQKADEMREDRYNDVLRDAGRWHLVGHDD